MVKFEEEFATEIVVLAAVPFALLFCITPPVLLSTKELLSVVYNEASPGWRNCWTDHWKPVLFEIPTVWLLTGDVTFLTVEFAVDDWLLREVLFNVLFPVVLEIAPVLLEDAVLFEIVLLPLVVDVTMPEVLLIVEVLFEAELATLLGWILVNTFHSKPVGVGDVLDELFVMFEVELAMDDEFD